MLKKLEIDALMADLEAVKALLAERTEAEDPIGFHQFTARKAKIEDEIKRLGTAFPKHAEMGVFFGGKPVQGSRGMNADFASKVLDEIQGLISTRFSEVAAGPPKKRGPLLYGDQAQMIVTDVMRGSFGFVLEEAGGDEEIVETALKEVVTEISSIISRIGALEEGVFEEAASELDERFLGQLKRFFQYMDDQAATIRIVNDNKDFLLDRNAITRAKTRIDGIEIGETILEISGQLYLLPESKKFDFIYEGDGERKVLKGTVGLGVFKQLAGEADFGENQIEVATLSSKMWNVQIKSKEIRERLRSPRNVYSLVKLNHIAE